MRPSEVKTMPGDSTPQPAPKNRKPKTIGGVPLPARVEVSPTRECVTLSKGQHRWTFSCPSGDEQKLLVRLAELARSEDVPFDWFDAALVSHQLRNRLLPGLSRIDPERPANSPTESRGPNAPNGTAG